MRELTLQRRLGHASPEATRVYTRVSDPIVVAEYRRALGSYLGDRPANAPAPSWAERLYASLRNPSAASTVKTLDALDAQRRNIEATVQPERSVQPSLAPLKF